MPQQLLLGFLLDGDGRQLVRALGSLAIVLLLGLVLVVVTPIALLAQATRAGGSGGSAAVAAAAGQGAPASAAPGGAARSVEPASDARRAAPPPTAGGGSAAVDIARRYLGVAYVFGGTNPAVGLDCSGLVQLVFRQLQIALPRTAQMQFDATARVAQADLQPGDLVFFARTYADPHDWITHVGIYIGGGLQINAPTEGQVVSIQPVFSGFWGVHYAGGGRVRAS